MHVAAGAPRTRRPACRAWQCRGPGPARADCGRSSAAPAGARGRGSDGIINSTGMHTRRTEGASLGLRCRYRWHVCSTKSSLVMSAPARCPHQTSSITLPAHRFRPERQVAEPLSLGRHAPQPRVGHVGLDAISAGWWVQCSTPRAPAAQWQSGHARPYRRPAVRHDSRQHRRVHTSSTAPLARPSSSFSTAAVTHHIATPNTNRRAAAAQRTGARQAAPATSTSLASCSWCRRRACWAPQTPCRTVCSPPLHHVTALRSTCTCAGPADNAASRPARPVSMVLTCSCSAARCSLSASISGESSVTRPSACRRDALHTPSTANSQQRGCGCHIAVIVREIDRRNCRLRLLDGWIDIELCAGVPGVRTVNQQRLRG